MRSIFSTFALMAAFALALTFTLSAHRAVVVATTNATA